MGEKVEAKAEGPTMTEVTEKTDQQNPEMLHFISRVGNWPVVSSALDQLAAIYEVTKESNRFVKSTLETAESGVKVAANTAKPIIDKLEKPISKIDTIADGGLQKVEEKCTVVTKTPGEIYDMTIQPAVDKVAAAKQYSIDTVNSVKDATVKTVTDVKDNTTQKVTSAKEYTSAKLEGMKQYTYDTVEGAKAYSTEKVHDVMSTPYGKTVTDKMATLLDTTDQYVDYILPEDHDEKEKDEDDKDKEVLDEGVLHKMSSVGDKMKRRMYNKALRDLKYVQVRSKETLEKLNFTVDLIEYAKVNIDGTKQKVSYNMSKAYTKLQTYWEEINTEEIEMEDLNSTEDKESKQPEQMTMEKKAIVVARHLTLRLKKGFATISDTAVNILPTSLGTKMSEARTYTEQLYQSFAGATSLKDVPSNLLTETKTRISQLQESMAKFTNYLKENYFTGKQETGNEDKEPEPKSDKNTEKEETTSDGKDEADTKDKANDIQK